MADTTEGRTTAFQHDHDAPTVGVSVHSTTKLVDRNGRAAEHSVVRYMAAAFDRAELNYEIDYGYPPKDPPNEVSVCGDGSGFGWWNERVTEDEPFPIRKDSNILLFDTNGGGCAYIGMNAATAPGMNITENRPHEWIGRDDYHRNIFGTMHELGHNLGFKHSPHPGMGWNEDGEWHRTFTVSANGEENLCGEWIEKREHTAEARHMYFHDCAIEHMQIADTEPLGPAQAESRLPEPDTGPSTTDPESLGFLASILAWLRRLIRRLLG